MQPPLERAASSRNGGIARRLINCGFTAAERKRLTDENGAGVSYHPVMQYGLMHTAKGIRAIPPDLRSDKI